MKNQMRHLAPMPNGLPAFKVAAMGEVKMIMMPVAQLDAALRTMGTADVISLDIMREKVGNFVAADFATLKEKGCSTFHTVLKQNEIIYIPCGFWVCEEPVEGPLIYGSRKTMVLKSQGSHANYEALVGVYRASGRGEATRMEELLPSLAASVD